MKAVGIAAAMAAGAAIASILPVATEGLPITWTHSLTSQCGWTARPWFRALPTASRAVVRLRVDYTLPDVVRDQLIACHVLRGLMNPQGSVNVIMRKWPSAGDFTAWRQDDGTDHVRTPQRR